jgi:L-threonylcarbamoyladenylate synthase
MNVPPVDARQIDRAVAILRQGGLVAMPTETVYGLAADADNAEAVRAVFAAKGRPADHPVIVHVADVTALDRWARVVPEGARALAKAFWPGPLTIVLPRSARASDLITGGQDTVGLRCPSHPWAHALLAAFGGAVVAPSANSFGRISPTTAAHVLADLGVKPAGELDFVLDGGPCPVGIESTIVDLSGTAPRLLRPGHVTREQLQRVLGRPVEAADEDAPRAPGRLEKHYSPQTPLALVAPEALRARIAELAGSRLAVLAPARYLEPLDPRLVLALPAANDPEEYARLLYTNLHRMDASGADLLLVAEPPQGPEWLAVHDRLNRAQAGAALASNPPIQRL